ncbi:MAG: class I SAM-dependent methyltransferase [Deltaproteobacteria bacterium]|nr:class I SAM-dependent methyltransferase [Deltaproteobacteria bacterium]MBZ0220259.1 class I SAM-dependent methyltransferase [Deltaproteobacteria bacterium]
MEEQEYGKMYELEESFWWFRGKDRILHGLLKKTGAGATRGGKILDIGCGTGRVLENLRVYGETYGIDFSATAIAFCRERGLKKLVRGTGDVLPFRDGVFDVVTALDVFCHRGIRDNKAALKEVARTLRSGGRFILSEPAFMFLYGPHDESQHCKQRFNAAEMKELMASCGLKIEKLSYFNFILFPLVLAHRLAMRWSGLKSQSDVKEINPVLNSILFLFLRLEAGLLRFMNLPAGSSVICVARKP